LTAEGFDLAEDPEERRDFRQRLHPHRPHHVPDDLRGISCIVL
jgi:hypothetical protein